MNVPLPADTSERIGTGLVAVGLVVLGAVLGVQVLGSQLAPYCVGQSLVLKPEWCSLLHTAGDGVRVGLVVFGSTFIAGMWLSTRGGADG